MIKLLAGAEPLTSGSYTLGHNVMPDYFAQDQYKELDTDARMLDDLSASAPRHSQTQLRSLLGCFLFSEDDVFKKIGVLSGGERNRYALARMLLAPSNFLLLDEPTNHLDMRAKDVLLEALKEYNGTVVFVSHDRYFIDNLATRVFEIQEGHVHVYPGNYEDYLWRKAGGPEAMLAEAVDAAPAEAGARGGCQKRQAASESDEGAEDARAAAGSGAGSGRARIGNPAARGRAGRFQERGRNDAPDRAAYGASERARSASGGVGRIDG